MYEGYLSHGGTEIINAERTAAYVRNQMPTASLVESIGCPDLPLVLGDGKYESPLVDGAPWLDESDPASQKFYGLYPISIQGISDSTLERDVTENLNNGGVAGAARHATRDIRVKALMYGETEFSLESGITWLRNALDIGDCSGSDCLGATLCYFADCPSVCEEATNPDLPIDGTATFGSLSPATSPLTHRFPRKVGPARAEWIVPPTEGAIIRYGAMSLTDQTQLWISDAIELQRTNYWTDPNSTSVRPWVRSGIGTMSVVAAGGADGGTFLRRTGDTSSTTIVTNWMGNPLFRDAPVSSGWVSNGLYGLRQVALGNGFAAEMEPSAASTTLWAEGVIAGPDAISDVAITMSISGTDDVVTIATLDPDGNVASSFQPELPLTMNSVGFTARAAAGWKLRVFVEAASAPLRFTSILITDSRPTTPGYFTAFDGETTPTANQHIFYLDGTRRGPSRRYTNTTTAAPSSSRSIAVDAPVGPTMVSFMLKTPGWAQVEMRTEDATTGAVLATVTHTLTPQWELYSVQSPEGKNIKVALLSRDVFDIDGGLIESGTMQRPHFSGASEITGHAVSWLGVPDASASRSIYVGELAVELDHSDWRPFIVSIIGNIPSLSVETRQYEQIDIEECVQIYRRSYHEVTLLSGPKITKKYAPSVGAMWAVEFLLNAAHPFAYGKTRELFAGPIGSVGSVAYVDPVIPTPPVTIIRDPDCPPLPLPPAAPIIADSCIEDITAWRRYRLSVPGDAVPEWAIGVPTITLQSGNTEYRQVRVRFHPNPFEWDEEDVDPLSFCSEFIVSYLPPNTRLVVDGTVERATAAVSGAEPIPANNLMYGTGGVPISWPALSCGVPYLVTVDVPAPGGNALGIDLALTRRE